MDFSLSGTEKEGCESVMNHSFMHLLAGSQGIDPFVPSYCERVHEILALEKNEIADSKSVCMYECNLTEAKVSVKHQVRRADEGV